MLRQDQLDGGSYARDATSTHVVTMWVLPDGWDLTKAVAVNIFFSDEEKAKAFAQRWADPPAMASI